MKTTGSLYSGSLADGNEDVYADYLVAYVKAYHEHGIDIDYLTIENEPVLDNRKYPVMEMGEYQELSVIQRLGPKLEAAGFGSVKVLAYDFNYSDAYASTATSFIDTILGDPEASKYTAGVAFHAYDSDGIDTFGQGFQYVHDSYPDKKSLVTEITEGTWSRDFASNLSYALTNVVLGPLGYSSTGALYWNAALYDDGTPYLGGAGNSLGVISVARCSAISGTRGGQATTVWERTKASGSWIKASRSGWRGRLQAQPPDWRGTAAGRVRDRRCRGSVPARRAGRPAAAGRRRTTAPTRPASPPSPCLSMLFWMSVISGLTSGTVRTRCKIRFACSTFDLLINQRGLSGSRHMPMTRTMDGMAAKPNI